MIKKNVANFCEINRTQTRISMATKLLFLITLLTIFSLSNASTKHKKHKHKQQKATVARTVTSTQPDMASGVRKQVASIIPTDQIDTQSVRSQPRLYSYSALAVNADTGKVIVRKNPNVQLPIASITKLMTAMVVLDSGADLDEYVTITDADVDKLRNTYSRLRVGMQLRRRDLLLLALMSSENRAAHALGRTAYPGGINIFIAKMNEKAKSLGMTNTQFYDPTGLTMANQSTAEDLSHMVEGAFEYDLIRKDTTTKSADVMLSPSYVHRYINSDALVRNGNFPIGLSKTGFINEAGHCLVLYSTVAGQPVIMVFLNSAGKSGRLIDAMAVKNYIQRNT